MTPRKPMRREDRLGMEISAKLDALLRKLDVEVEPNGPGPEPTAPTPTVREARRQALQIVYRRAA